MSVFKNLFGSQEDKPASKVEWKKIEHRDQLDFIINESWEKPVLIFKHSTRCGISRMVLRQFESEFDLQGEVTPYFLDLLKYRELSNEVALTFVVQHQSPQVILIKDGVPVYNASHENIHAEKLKPYL